MLTPQQFQHFLIAKLILSSQLKALVQATAVSESLAQKNNVNNLAMQYQKQFSPSFRTAE